MENKKAEEKIILWVDDNPENNIAEVKEAEKTYLLKVVQKKSTNEAMSFLKANPNLKEAPPSHFRVITDCYRYSPYLHTSLIKKKKKRGEWILLIF